MTFAAGDTGHVVEHNALRSALLINVDDYGNGLISGTSTANRANNDLALLAALAAAETGDAILTGRIIRFPMGRYTLSPFSLTNTHSDKITSITLEGESQHNTILDFTGTTGDGITIPGSAGIRIRDLTARSAAGHNIAVYGVSGHDGGGGALTTNSYWLGINRVRVQAAGESGLFLSGSILTTVSDVLALSNGTHGIEVGGYTTSTVFQTCQARLNTLDGWKLNDLTYSSFAGCASDANGRAGYWLTNVDGVSFAGCGAEGNQRDGVLAEASTALNAAAIADDVRGVVWTGGFFYNNGIAGTTYANAFRATPLDSRPIDITLIGVIDDGPQVGANSLIATGLAVLTRIGGALEAPVSLDATALAPVLGAATVVSSVEAAVLMARGTDPTIPLRETDAATDEKNWHVAAAGGQFKIVARNDALSTAENAYVMDRTGANVTTHQWFISGGEGLALTEDRLKASVPVGLPSYTVATLPVATTAGRIIYVSDESGGATPAFSDGTNWRRYSDRAVVT